jgi:hypothetical protein
MEALSVPRPLFRLVYAGRDITAHVTPYALSVSYVDHLHGESDQVEVVLEDADGRWRSAWYPQKGDQIELSLGHEDRGLRDCGIFQVDEVELSGPPDQVHLRALATGVTKAARTTRSRAREATTLRAIVEDVARALDLVIVGEVADIEVGRLTQLRETDLAFLGRVAAAYGHCFSVRGRQLVFHRLEALEASAEVLVLRRSDLLNYSLRDQSRTAYQAAEVRYQDPHSGELRRHVAAGEAGAPDALRLEVRAESPAQAEALAVAALAGASRRRVEGSVEFPGDARVVAGVRLGLLGLGRLDGTYTVQSSRHSVSRGAGYRTSCEVRRA